MFSPVRAVRLLGKKIGHAQIPISAPLLASEHGWYIGYSTGQVTSTIHLTADRSTALNVLTMGGSIALQQAIGPPEWSDAD